MNSPWECQGVTLFWYQIGACSIELFISLILLSFIGLLYNVGLTHIGGLFTFCFQPIHEEQKFSEKSISTESRLVEYLGKSDFKLSHPPHYITYQFT